MSRSSEQHDRSSQGRGPNSPIVALIQLGPLGCPAVHFGAQWLTVDIAVQVASLRGRRTLTFKNHIQVAHSCVAVMATHLHRPDSLDRSVLIHRSLQSGVSISVP